MRAHVVIPASSDLWADGGFTLALNYQTPPARFLASDAGGAEFDREPTEAELSEFIRTRWPALSRDGAYFGGWKDPASGRYFLDVSRGFEDRAAALEAGRRAGQLAIYDSQTGESVPV